MAGIISTAAQGSGLRDKGGGVHEYVMGMSLVVTAPANDNMLQTGDVVEELRIRNGGTLSAPLKNGKSGLQKELHKFYRKHETLVQVRVRRGRGLTAELQACVTPDDGTPKKQQYMLRALSDPNYVIALVDSTLEGCLALQESRYSRVKSALSHAQLKDGYVAYAWEEKMHTSSGSFFSLLVIPHAPDGDIEQYLVQLQGWCTEKGEILVLYDYLMNRSLSKMLCHKKGFVLDWPSRYKIAKGLSASLLYLHEECEQQVIHWDVKASNIMLDLDYNARLGDFGLARLIEHNRRSMSLPGVVGTVGYIAQECLYTGRATAEADVFSFGAVILEVISGRHPVEEEIYARRDIDRSLMCGVVLLVLAVLIVVKFKKRNGPLEVITGKQPIDPTIPEGVHLVEWARDAVQGNKLADSAEVIDPRLQGRPGTQIQEMLQVLGVAFLCVNSNPDDERPTMKDVAALLKEICYDCHDSNGMADLLRKQTPKPASTRSPNPTADARSPVGSSFGLEYSSASTTAHQSYSLHSSVSNVI